MKQYAPTIAFFSILSLAAAAVLYFVLRPTAVVLPEIDEQARLEAYLLLLGDLGDQANDYPEYLRRFPIGAGPEASEPIRLVGADTASADTIQIPAGGNLILDAAIEFAGHYTPILTYRREDSNLANLSLELSVDGSLPFNEARELVLPRMWQDETKSFSRDRYNDESLPRQIPVTETIQTGIYDAAGRTVEPISLFLDSGRHSIGIRNLSASPVILGGLDLVPRRPIPSYAEYRAGATAASAGGASSGARGDVAGADGASAGSTGAVLAVFGGSPNGPESSAAEENHPEQIRIDAIEYLEKNAYDLRMGSGDNPALTPFHAVDKLLNIIDGASWDRAGEEVVYRVSVPRAGWYALSFHYNNPHNDFSRFRSVRIDGQVPFREAAAYEFPRTGAGRWANLTLTDGEGRDLLFYLSEGTHELGLRAEKEPVAESIRALKTIIAHMNFFGIEIMKVAGRTIDENRTWRLTDYLPNTARYLEAYRVLITDIIGDLSRYSAKGESSAMTASLRTALFKLDKLAEDPDDLPI